MGHHSCRDYCPIHMRLQMIRCKFLVMMPSRPSLFIQGFIHILLHLMGSITCDASDHSVWDLLQVEQTHQGICMIQIRSPLLSMIAHVQRNNNTGGTVPGNPKVAPLPVSPQGVPNALLCVPFQSDYTFWVPSTAWVQLLPCSQHTHCQALSGWRRLLKRKESDRLWCT